MKAMQFNSRVDADGVLRIEVPVGLTDRDLEVLVVVSPVGAAPVVVDGNWPPNFFAETFGCFAESALERPVQGEYEIRNLLR
jgi:hypothetical protein